MKFRQGFANGRYLERMCRTIAVAQITHHRVSSYFQESYSGQLKVWIYTFVCVCVCVCVARSSEVGSAKKILMSYVVI